MLHDDDVQLLKPNSRLSATTGTRACIEEVAQPAHGPCRRGAPAVAVRAARQARPRPRSGSSALARKAPVTSSPAPTSASAKTRRPVASADEADGDDAVAAEALERATLHAEHRPQHRGHGHGGGRPASGRRSRCAAMTSRSGTAITATTTTATASRVSHGLTPDARVRIVARKRARHLARDGDL